MIRRLVERIFKKQDKNPLIKDFVKYHKHTKDAEIQSMISYIKAHETFDMMNCELSKDYTALEVESAFDSNEGLYYVWHEGKKVYFKKGFSEQQVIQSFKALVKEQDEKSPHRYLSKQDIMEIESYKAAGGAIRVFECGGMEGMFSLNLVDMVDEIYIFECDKDWIDALKCTFAPYKEKVHLVNAYVADGEGETVSLDSYTECLDIKTLGIVKMDIEGAEIRALKGMKKFMEKAANFKLFVCTYHRQNDEQLVREICKQYEIIANKGYFCFFVDPEYAPPFVRRCLLKVKK